MVRVFRNGETIPRVMMFLDWDKNNWDYIVIGYEGTADFAEEIAARLASFAYRRVIDTSSPNVVIYVTYH